MNGGQTLESYRITNLKSFLDEVSQVYDAIRIIEPIKKQIVHYEGRENIINHPIYCRFWEKEDICHDCILECDIIDEKTLLRIEDSGDRRLRITARPFIFGDNRYILEMAQDITEAKAESNQSK